MIPTPGASTVSPGAAAPASSSAGARLESVDALRGLVMVLMALDHARAFFHEGALRGVNPLDPALTTPALFFTRWITHLCAPVFILLAGAGACLSRGRGRSDRELSWFLLTRGAWLIVLEVTFVQWAGWTFALNLHVHHANVLWAIGWSMIALAAIVHLPVRWVAVFGVAMIAGHNLLDPLKPADFGAWAPLWQVLHAGGQVKLGGGHVLAAGYPLIPWVGVMAAGYGLGTWLQQDPGKRVQRLARLGAALCAGFVLLRWSNLYGDPRPWAPGRDSLRTVHAFLDCQKYPPSLAFLLMTLGPALLLLAWWDRRLPAWAQPLQIFGRVPMFFYLLHLPLLHGLAVGVSYVSWGRADWLHGLQRAAVPDGAGFGLTGVYVAWLATVALLYPVSRPFAALKRRSRRAWLSYL